MKPREIATKAQPERSIIHAGDSPERAVSVLLRHPADSPRAERAAGVVAHEEERLEHSLPSVANQLRVQPLDAGRLHNIKEAHQPATSSSHRSVLQIFPV